MFVIMIVIGVVGAMDVADQRAQCMIGDAMATRRRF